MRGNLQKKRHNEDTLDSEEDKEDMTEEIIEDIEAGVTPRMGHKRDLTYGNMSSKHTVYREFYTAHQGELGVI